MAENEEKKRGENEEEYESNAAKRLRVLGGAETESESDPEPVRESFFGNLWYHYKAPILIFIGFALIFAVGITQMVRNKKADVFVLFAGAVTFDSDSAAAAEDALSSLASADGTTHVARFTTLFYVSDEKAAAASEEAKKKNEWSPLERYAKSQENRDAYAAFSNNMLAGDSVICLLDPYLFETIRDAGGLMKLEEVVGYRPEGSIDEYGIPAVLVEFFGKNKAFSSLPDDTVLCIRRVSTMSAFTGKKREEEAHRRHVEFAGTIFAYRAEDAETE